MKKFMIVLFVILLIVVIVGLFFVKNITAAVEIDADTNLTIAEGSSTSQISATLLDAGLIKNTSAFRLFARNQGVDSLFKAGEYTFSAGSWSLEDVCMLLVAGTNGGGNGVWVTIPEGLTANATFAILVSEGLGDMDQYLSYAENGSFEEYSFIPAQSDVVAPGNRLDGFLFPDTYMIDPSWSEEKIVDMLLSQFLTVWQENDFAAQAETRGLSVYDVVTMAAIIEREARVAEDRPIISGVFYKRLDLGWKLESCATIQFLLEEPKEVLLYSDLEIESAYNTYKNVGLPPGPIAAPGLASLKAALYPTESDYLYFKARLDGSHRFSTNLSEHEAYHEGDQ